MTNRLLSPAAIGSMSLRNRIVMAPMGVEIVGADGQVNEAVIATGAAHRASAIPGAAVRHVIGGSSVGIELAEFFVERGHAVAVLEEGEKFALEMAHPRRWRVLGDLREAGASLIANAANIEIGPPPCALRCRWRAAGRGRVLGSG